ncbi:MAG: thioredoxin family protein [Acidimicrobiales bacterium]
MGFRYAHKASHAAPGKLAELVAKDAAQDKVLLLEFAAADAPACRLEHPVLSEILRRYADRMSVIQADVESSPEDAEVFGVTAVPTFVLFVEGKERLRLVGYQTLDALTTAIDDASGEPRQAPGEPR